jgi:hypothetical protein
MSKAHLAIGINKCFTLQDEEKDLKDAYYLNKCSAECEIICHKYIKM